MDNNNQNRKRPSGQNIGVLALILGLENIRDEYGAEYIKFRFREV